MPSCCQQAASISTRSLRAVTARAGVRAQVPATRRARDRARASAMRHTVLHAVIRLSDERNLALVSSTFKNASQPHDTHAVKHSVVYTSKVGAFRHTRASAGPHVSALGYHTQRLGAALPRAQRRPRCSEIRRCTRVSDARAHPLFSPPSTSSSRPCQALRRCLARMCRRTSTHSPPSSHHPHRRPPNERIVR